MTKHLNISIDSCTAENTLSVIQNQCIRYLNEILIGILDEKIDWLILIKSSKSSYSQINDLSTDVFNNYYAILRKR